VKGLILAGGRGTRLRPITHTSAKQLVPVANKPILFYGLEAMVEAGILDVGIIVGDTAPEIRAAVGDGSTWGLRVTYIEQEAPLGLAHCVRIAGEFLGDEEFVMYLGDNLLREGVQPFVQAFAGSGANARILLAAVPDPQRFGVAELDERGDVVRLVEKPAHPPSNLALVGVYLFDASIHAAVREITPSARGELEITDAIQWLIDNGRAVTSQVVTGWWIDTGQLSDLLEGNRLVLEMLTGGISGSVDDRSCLEGAVVVGPGASVVASTITGPAIVGEGTLVEQSRIGPFTSIDARCRVVRSEISNSIMLSDSAVTDVSPVEESLIGRAAEVVRSDAGRPAYRLMLGDHSRAEVL
jgi:glucose-1-phosphate thymidylyltransferase